MQPSASTRNADNAEETADFSAACTGPAERTTLGPDSGSSGGPVDVYNFGPANDGDEREMVPVWRRDLETLSKTRLIGADCIERMQRT